MARPTFARLPLEPLARAHNVTIDQPEHDQVTGHWVASPGSQFVAELFDVDVRSINRWNVDGIPITPRRLEQLEDICDAIRRPPAMVWGQAWYVATAEYVDGDGDWFSDDPSLDELAAWDECPKRAA